MTATWTIILTAGLTAVTTMLSQLAILKPIKRAELNYHKTISGFNERRETVIKLYENYNLWFDLLFNLDIELERKGFESQLNETYNAYQKFSMADSKLTLIHVLDKETVEQINNLRSLTMEFQRSQVERFTNLVVLKQTSSTYDYNKIADKHVKEINDEATIVLTQRGIVREKLRLIIS